MAVRAAIYRKKSNPLKGKVIEYKDVKLLSHYITERGKIVPSRISGVSQRINVLWRLRLNAHVIWD